MLSNAQSTAMYKVQQCIDIVVSPGLNCSSMTAMLRMSWGAGVQSTPGGSADRRSSWPVSSGRHAVLLWQR